MAMPLPKLFRDILKRSCDGLFKVPYENRMSHRETSAFIIFGICGIFGGVFISISLLMHETLLCWVGIVYLFISVTSGFIFMALFAELQIIRVRITVRYLLPLSSIPLYINHRDEWVRREAIERLREGR